MLCIRPADVEGGRQVPRFDDYFELYADFAPELLQIRDVVRRFVEEQVRPQVAEWWLAGEFPRHLVPRLGELGIFGATLPERYGGGELPATAYGLMMQELERGDSGLRSFASVQSSLTMYGIYRWGSEEQKQHYLPRMAKGEWVGCFGLTEPDAGSDPASMITRARKTDRGWVLQGAKRWITNGNLADVALVWAKDESDTVRGFLVPAGQPGFSARAIHSKASMRMSVTSELFLDNVEVGEEARLPQAAGLGAPLSCLTQARFSIVWGTVGAAMACLEEALAYTGSRIAFGRPIAATQLVQERLVDMLSRLAAMQLRAWQLARLYEGGRMHHLQVSLAKRDNARAALEVARAARELLGGNGITVDYGAMRHMANLETVDTYEGTYEVHTLAVGRDLTGHHAF